MDNKKFMYELKYNKLFMLIYDRSFDITKLPPLYVKKYIKFVNNSFLPDKEYDYISKCITLSNIHEYIDIFDNDNINEKLLTKLDHEIIKLHKEYKYHIEKFCSICNEYCYFAPVWKEIWIKNNINWLELNRRYVIYKYRIFTGASHNIVRNYYKINDTIFYTQNENNNSCDIVYNIYENIDYNFFVICSEYGIIDIVKYLAGSILDYNVYSNGIIFASKSGHLDIVKFLISGIDFFNAKDINLYNNALIIGGSSGKLSMVKYFINKGADLNAKYNFTCNIHLHDNICYCSKICSYRNMSLLYVATVNNCINIIKYLFTKFNIIDMPYIDNNIIILESSLIKSMTLADKTIFKYLILNKIYNDDDYLSVLDIIFKVKDFKLMLFLIKDSPCKNFIYNNRSSISKFCIENKCSKYLQYMPNKEKIFIFKHYKSNCYK